MRILVTGATGTVGSAVLRRLAEDGHDAVAAVRHPETRTLPAPAVAFDFEQPETFADALRGAHALFLMRPPTAGAGAVNPVVDAAQRAGVRRVAFLSVLGADKNPVLPHRATERHIEKTDLDAAFLRAAYFMQNLSEVHADDVRRGVISVPAGDAETSFVDARDVGDVAAQWLTGGERGQRGLDLTGPEVLDMFEVAAVLSDVLGRRVVYRKPGVATFVKERLAAGDTLAFALVMSGLYTATRLGLADRVTDTVEQILRRPPTSMRAWAEEVKAVWT